MKHFWKRIKSLLISLAIIFTFCVILSILNQVNVAANIATLITLLLPLYLVYLCISEIIYHHKTKKEAQIHELKNNNMPHKKNSVNSTLENNVEKQSGKHITNAQNPVQKASKPIQKNKYTKTSPHVDSSSTIKITSTPIEKIHTHRKTTAKPYTLHHLRRKLYNFVVVDCETTGLPRDSKVIQLSAIRFFHDNPVETFNEYVNPGIPIPGEITAITGIDDATVRNAPKFSEIKDKFSAFVGTLPWVGHNINSYDIPVLFNNGLAISDISTIDTLKLAENKLNMDHYGLADLKKYFGIQNGSHNSLEDCKTNAIVYQHLRDDNLAPVQADYSSIPQVLAGKQFAISGSFSGYSKADIKEMVVSHGGIVKGISHRTDYLIDGTQTSKSLTDGVHSNKELKARDYGIPIISITEFKHMLVADA